MIIAHLFLCANHNISCSGPSMLDFIVLRRVRGILQVSYSLHHVWFAHALLIRLFVSRDGIGPRLATNYLILLRLFGEQQRGDTGK